ncbi:hypothetical protein PT974_01191 [Cladobotryum mycophilum]|uniref:F-box domain-containing protein n=1 Tax=Cladobotryum mycophilum TaxID=491253 RepID=A0ABR0T2Z9_9HYPO
MPSIQSLPDHIIIDIIALALGLPATSLKPVKDSAALATLRSLRLVSSRVYALTNYVYYNKHVFKARCCTKLHALAASPNLRLMRNMSIVLFSDCTDFEVPPIDPGPVAAYSAWPILRLPTELQRLYLSPPGLSWPFFTDHDRTHPMLSLGLRRLKNLRELYLDFHKDWLRFDLFSSIFSKCTWMHVTLAFSQEQLPSLKSLTLDCILYNDHVDYIFYPYRMELFSPEAIMAMNPLEEFKWVHYNMERLAPGEQRRHGATLKTLNLDYGTFPAACTRLRERDVKLFLAKMPGLKRVRIHAPKIDVDINEWR